MTRALACIEFYGIYAAGVVLGCGVVVRYLRSPNPDVSLKLLRAFGAVIGSNTTIKGSVFLDNVFRDANCTGDFSHLTIGENCYIGEAVFFDLAGNITIENDVVVSGRVSFITHADCNRSQYLSLKFPRKCDGVTVRNGAWLGFNVTVLAGVTVGRQSVIGAGSVITRDAGPQQVYIGAPAKSVRYIE